MYVLDTNTLIYFFKGLGHVADKLLDTAPSEIALPALVLFELELGIAKSQGSTQRRKQLDEFLALTSLWPFAAKEARAAAKIRAFLEQQGRPIGPFDLLIAGTALANGGTLVTHNSKEFERVPGLACVDWY